MSFSSKIIVVLVVFPTDLVVLLSNLLQNELLMSEISSSVLYFLTE